MGGNIRFIALAITLSGISTICGSQSTYHFRHYDISDGLASNYLTSVVQDSLGFIWISTDAGVTRFDGYSFRNYQFDPNDSSKLALSVNTVDLAIDHQGTLWMTPPYSGRSPVGFAKYDFRGDRFVHYEIDVNNARIYGMSFEKDYPVIWFRTMGDGLYRFNYTTKETRHYYNPGVSADISYRQNSISDFEDLGGFLLLATEEGLWLVEKSTGHFSRPVINVKDSGYLLRSHTFALFKSHQYKYSTDIAYWLLINVDDGDLLAGIDRNYAIVKQFRLPKGLGNWSISDRKDVFWLNYGSKIVQLNPADGAVTELVHLPTDPFSLRLARVRNMFADRDNNLWLATDHGLSVTTGDKIAVQTTRIRTGRIRGSGLLELPEGNFLTISVEGSLSSGQEILIAPIGTGPELLSFTQLLMMKGNAVYAFHQGKKYFWIASVGRGASVVGLPLHQILHKPKPAIILQRDSEAAYTIDL
ncbi:MAG: two-component regulator propeller domain-containing protein, partial [Nitrospiraceae bacterium]